MDLFESADGKTLTAVFDLPGVDKKKISIKDRSDCLTVSGESNIASEVGLKSNSYRVRERPYGNFSRTLALPAGTQVRSLSMSSVVGFPRV